MPELPEVETVVRTLEKQIKGREIIRVDVRYPKIVENGDAAAFSARLQQQHFCTFARRGKYLLFGMDDCLLVVHLRMEGKFYLQSPQEAITRHMHVLFQLDDGRQLRYHDTRKFGRMEIMEPDVDLRSFTGWVRSRLTPPSTQSMCTDGRRAGACRSRACCWIKTSWPASAISMRMKFFRPAGFGREEAAPV